jgi:16S rRNA (guanine527-N7)-methyltransferase
MKKYINNTNVCSWQRWLRYGSNQLKIDIGDTQINQLRCFADELFVANQAVNLTRVTDPLEIAEKLMLDSIVPGRFIPSGASVLDLGTGAGFPGIPLKIAFPTLSLTLIDGRRKKINFVKFIIRRLNLHQANAMQARSESLAALPEFAAAFDVVISRAVSALDRFVSMASPFLKKEGVLIAMKGSMSSLMQEEGSILSDGLVLSDLGFNKQTDIQLIPYQLPFSKKERTLVLLRQDGKRLN